jgi:hypothetical protein
MNFLKRTLLVPVVLTFALGFALAHAAHAQDIRTGDALLRAMHDRYQASWYKTLTFTQESTTYKPDGTHTSETWYEAALLPGKLRIDIGPPANGNGYVLSDGTVTVVKNNQVAGSRPLVNILLVLGFDVYTQAPEATIKVVQGEGYDLSKLRDDTWEGHPAYVVGADKGDLTSRQFWVTKDTLLVRARNRTRARRSQARSTTSALPHYQSAGPGLGSRHASKSIPKDKLVFSEDYTDIQPNVKLGPEGLRSPTVQHHALGKTVTGTARGPRDRSPAARAFGKTPRGREILIEA